MLARMQFESGWADEVANFVDADVANPDFTDFTLMRMACFESHLSVTAIRPMDKALVKEGEEDDDEEGEEGAGDNHAAVRADVGGSHPSLAQSALQHLVLSV